MDFVKAISESEKVCINSKDEAHQAIIWGLIEKYNIDKNQIEVPIHPNNDSW
jgi:agmatine deiminase